MKDKMKDKIMTRFLFLISLVVGGYVITIVLLVIEVNRKGIEIVLTGFTIAACLLYAFLENRIMARIFKSAHG